MKHTLRWITLGSLFFFMTIVAGAVVAMAGGRPLPMAVTFVSTLACFLFSLLHAGQHLGWRPALVLLGLCFAVALLFESLGVATGWVYGPYHYSAQLGPKFLGLVPYLIPLAWFMMMYPSYLMARRLLPLLRLRRGSGLALAALAGLIMTGWDMTMDPLMVQSGRWVWEVNGAYFGVPVHNFIGWWATTFVTFGLFLLLFPAQKEVPAQASQTDWERWAYLSYFVTGASNAAAAALSGLGGPALVGVFSMAPWLLLAWRVSLPEKQNNPDR
jgi:putative membrane protein